MKNTFGKEIIPKNDEERLKALHRYEILDTPPEDAFNNIANIMADVFDVPIALISLVDKERVFFKARVGMPGADNIARGISLCSLGILTPEPTVFEDALKEPCLIANPLVQGKFGLRFYAGAPVVTPDGFNIGTVCIVDKKARGFTDREKERLVRFSKVVMHEIELRLAAQLRANELEAKVRERTIDLQNTKIELERSNKELEEFAYIASHDLKEPVRKMRVFTNMFIEGYSHELSEDGRNFFGRIKNAGQRMDALIEGILNFSIIGKMQNTFERTDMNMLLSNALTDLDVAIQQKNAVIEKEELPIMNVVSVQLQQLFYNLLTNSLKFSRENETSLIKITCRKINGKEVGQYKDLNAQKNYYLIEFADNGIGFSQEYAEKIFKVFQRLNDRYSYEGTGIGLAICKKIAQNHGGNIYAEGEVNKGAVFKVFLPAD